MKALPSIAFNDFSGTDGDVTARFVKGRTILTVRPFPSKVVSGSQKDNRNALPKISHAFKKLTDSQMAEWAELAKHLKTASILGITAEMTAHNAFVRLNSNRVMAGESILTDAPSSNSSIPLVEYEHLYVTPDIVALTGVRHQPSPYKLVIKMSASQSNGISNGWGKMVIISSDMEDDWGEADVTELYLKKLGEAATLGQKVFLEAYWMDTNTGFTGLVYQDYAICEGVAPYTRRVRATMDKLDPTEESHVSALDVDFSTGTPVAEFNAMCLGHSYVASSEVYLDEQLPEDVVGTGMCLCHSCDDQGHINASPVWCICTTVTASPSSPSPTVADLTLSHARLSAQASSTNL